MNIALICSNALPIGPETAKGTEIFVYSFIKELSKHLQETNLNVTVFAAGNSTIPLNKVSLSYDPVSANADISNTGKHIMFELALISKAFEQQDKFDLYHINIGDGDIVMPFAPFVKKPLLITLHHIIDANFTRKYFDLYSHHKHVHFISASKAQQNILPNLNYEQTIYHGIDSSLFSFNPNGGTSMMWAGRAIPVKGLVDAITTAKQVKQEIQLFGIEKQEYRPWLEQEVLPLLEKNTQLIFGHNRQQLIAPFQTSKLFLFPVGYEESFGLVLAEAMSCGTPVIAYARGSIPEIVKDGETGFLVNSSSDDIRGNWIIKKTGIDGLIEAVNRIYSMDENSYKKMRQQSRLHVEKNFTVERMVKEYEQVYSRIANIKS